MIYAISDLHLSFGNNKPMDIFGVNWENHYIKIADDWKKKVKPEDVVILAGDFSWATYLDDTMEDFKFLNLLPGKKILLKGNHDYWWTTVNKMNTFLKENNFENIYFLFNNSIEDKEFSICGTRGWTKTNGEQYDDEKIFHRECQRLEFSLKKAQSDKIIVVTHFIPTREMIEMMKQYKVEKCIYGHLHQNYDGAILGNKEGIEYYLTSSDYLNFKLIQIS